MTSSLVRFGAMLLTAGALLSADAAFAQATKPANPAAPPAGAAARPTGPIVLNLVAGQQPWTKICGKDPSGKELCYTTRDFGQSAEQPQLAVAVYQLVGEDKRLTRFLLPLGLKLKPGFRLILDKGEPLEGKYDFCFPNGCFGEVEMNTSQMNALKKATTASVVVRNQGNLEVTFNVPMADFGAAFDGPAVDPKVLEQQNAELQKQLEERARQQRELLEKGQGVAPGVAPAPAPAPAK